MLTSNQDGTEMEGLPVLFDVYCNHRDNAEVIESICTVLMELAEYGKTWNTSTSRTIPSATNYFKYLSLI